MTKLPLAELSAIRAWYEEWDNETDAEKRASIALTLAADIPALLAHAGALAARVAELEAENAQLRETQADMRTLVNKALLAATAIRRAQNDAP